MLLSRLAPSLVLLIETYPHQAVAVPARLPGPAVLPGLLPLLPGDRAGGGQAGQGHGPPLLILPPALRARGLPHHHPGHQPHPALHPPRLPAALQAALLPGAGCWQGRRHPRQGTGGGGGGRDGGGHEGTPHLAGGGLEGAPRLGGGGHEGAPHLGGGGHEWAPHLGGGGHEGAPHLGGGGLEWAPHLAASDDIPSLSFSLHLYTKYSHSRSYSLLSRRLLCAICINIL